MSEQVLPDVLTFEPILMPKVWGGRRLEGWGKVLADGRAIGESWEVADLPGDGPCSVVDAGPMAGRSLRQIVDTHQSALMGSIPPNAEGRFPLLIKFLDARENLSVQVHPDGAWVATHPGDHLKSEAWVVLETTPGGLIHAGLRPATSIEALAEAVGGGGGRGVVDLLRSVPARVGDCHTLVSGTCHALGAGVLVAEVQTTSDTTFRVHDWGRTDREIHVEQALACIDPAATPPCVQAPPPPAAGIAESVIAGTEQFTMSRIDSAGGVWTRFDDDAPSVIMCVAGEGLIGDMVIPRGRTALIPACAGDVDVQLGAGSSLVLAESKIEIR